MRLFSVMLLCCTDLRTSLAFRLGGSPSVRTFTYFPVVRRRPTKGIATMTRSTQSSVTRVVFKLNASTKWLVTAAVTTTVLMRRDFIAPYTAVGGIVATFGTDLLKKAINQDRPAGAPFTDPGMPSSHALVSTFLAVGWTITLGLTPVSGVVLACALAVSLLRVACGYHSWAQVLVGGVIGASSAPAWMSLGDVILTRFDTRVATAAVWSAYLATSVAFILKKVATWRGRDRDM